MGQRRDKESIWKGRSRTVFRGNGRGRSIAVVLAGAAVVCLGLVVLLFRPAPDPAPARPTPAPSGVPTPAAAAPAPAEQPLPAASLARELAAPPARPGEAIPLRTGMDRATAERFIEQQNAAARRQHELLVADGWTPVDMPPPEPALMALDPSLLNGREAELRRQIETNSLRDDQLENAQAIALQAKERRTRHAAIQALGRARSRRGQWMLTEVYEQLADPIDQELLLGFLYPRSLGEPTVPWMLQKLASPDVPSQHKKQMSFSLVLAELVEAGPDHQNQLSRLLDQVPEGLRPMMLETYQTVTGISHSPNP